MESAKRATAAAFMPRCHFAVSPLIEVLLPLLGCSVEGFKHGVITLAVIVDALLRLAGLFLVTPIVLFSFRLVLAALAAHEALFLHRCGVFLLIVLKFLRLKMHELSRYAVVGGALAFYVDNLRDSFR